MIEISYNVQIQMINSKGLLAISYYLEKVIYFKRKNKFNAILKKNLKASREHITVSVLNSILKLTKYLVLLPNPNGTILLKQLLDHILFNPSIWIYCSVDVILFFICKLLLSLFFARFKQNYIHIWLLSL